MSMDYTNPKNRINNNLSIDYNINTIPTLIVDKPKNKKVALNFPSVDYVEKPSNKFSLSIDNILADTDNFLDNEPRVNEVYIDDGRYSFKNYDWLISANGDMIVDDDDTTFVHNYSNSLSFFSPNYEFERDDGFFIEYDYIKTYESHSESVNMVFITDKGYKVNFNFNDLEINDSGKIKVILLGNNLTIYLNNRAIYYDGNFKLYSPNVGDTWDYENFYFRFELTNYPHSKTTLTYKNFIMYTLNEVLVCDNNTNWTNEVIDDVTYITKESYDENYDIIINGTNNSFEDDIEFYPLMDNNQFFLSGDNDIEFVILLNDGNVSRNNYLIFKDIYDNTLLIKFDDLLPKTSPLCEVIIKINDNKINISNDYGDSIVNDFNLKGLYGMGVLLPKSSYDNQLSNIDIVIENLIINKPLGLWYDDGGDLTYNINTVEYEPTTDISYDTTGTTFKSKSITSKGYVIPTLNGDYDTPYILKGSSDFEIDYYYENDELGHNSIFISNRLGSQNHNIVLNDLGLTENCRLKVVVTNEFQVVGSEDANANVKVYVGEFGTDNFNDTPVYDKDISISIVRAGYYYGMKQMYKDTNFKFKNLKIKTYSYDYDIGVVCRGYNDMGIKEIWSDEVLCTVNTHDRKLLAKFDDVPLDVKYLDFLLLIEDDRISKLEINKIMLYDGFSDNEYSEDTSISNLDNIDINFDRNYFCNYYNSSASDPTGLCIIRPTYESITLKTLTAPEVTDKDGNKGVTVLYPYLKNAKDYNTPERVALEYLNSCNQTIRLIYNG